MSTTPVAPTAAGIALRWYLWSLHMAYGYPSLAAFPPIVAGLRWWRDMPAISSPFFEVTAREVAAREVAANLMHYVAVLTRSIVGEWHVQFPDLPWCETYGFTVSDATFAATWP
jgi:hypothetical protein